MVEQKKPAPSFGSVLSLKSLATAVKITSWNSIPSLTRELLVQFLSFFLFFDKCNLFVIKKNLVFKTGTRMLAFNVKVIEVFFVLLADGSA